MESKLREFKAQIFHALAHPTRIAIVDALRGGELGAGALGKRLDVEQANLSQHLAVLRARQIVIARRDGNQVYYAIRDRVLTQILDLLKKYFYAHLKDTLTLMDEMKSERRPS